MLGIQFYICCTNFIRIGEQICDVVTYLIERYFNHVKKLNSKHILFENFLIFDLFFEVITIIVFIYICI